MFVCGMIGVNILCMLGFRQLLLWWATEQVVALAIGASIPIQFVLHYGLVVPLMRLRSSAAAAPTTAVMWVQRVEQGAPGLSLSVFVQ